jgi:hypothetical protein
MQGQSVTVHMGTRLAEGPQRLRIMMYCGVFVGVVGVPAVVRRCGTREARASLHAVCMQSCSCRPCLSPDARESCSCAPEMTPLCF